MQNINGFVSVPVSFAGLQTIDQQPAGLDPFRPISVPAAAAVPAPDVSGRPAPFPGSAPAPFPFRLYGPFQPVPGSPAPFPFPLPSAAFTARSRHSCRVCTRSCFIFLLTVITISSNIIP